jgi:hypothetical protein
MSLTSGTKVIDFTILIQLGGYTKLWNFQELKPSLHFQKTRMPKF